MKRICNLSILLRFHPTTRGYKIVDGIEHEEAKKERNSLLLTTGYFSFGISEDLYNNLDDDGKEIYWKIEIMNIYVRWFLGYEKDKEFIEMRDDLEKRIYGEINYEIPRLPCEEITPKGIDIIKKKLEKFEYGWLIDTRWYWNQQMIKKYGSRTRKTIDFMRLQSHKRYDGFGTITDKYDHNYSYVVCADVKPKVLYGLNIEDIAELVNFIPLLLNTLDILTGKKNEERLEYS